MPWRFPTPDPLPPALWPEILVVTSTVLGEAAGEGRAGQRAVAMVIAHRARDEKGRWPKTYAGVCLQPRQFSCWDDERTLPKMRFPMRHVGEDVWESCFLASIEALYGYEPSYIGGANHYLNEAAVLKASGKLPGWFDQSKVTIRIGRHTFLEL